MIPNRVRPALQFLFFRAAQAPFRTLDAPPHALPTATNGREARRLPTRKSARISKPPDRGEARRKKKEAGHIIPARCSNLPSLWAWSRRQELFWGSSGPSISAALHSGGHMKPPGAPEVPMDARKRKGLIGTKVRGEILRGPGARCVVQIFEKRPQSKCVQSPKIPQNMTPDPVTFLTATASNKKSSGGVWGRPDWL